jgi:predicted metal-dependent HD superfamily phosphohydrolase
MDAGASEEMAQRVHALVMATRHHQPGVEGDASLLVDVDLSILAAPPDRFEEYERQIRAEYDYVPLALFRQERKKILQGFLNRPRIYRTKTFFERYEATARKNLERAIEASV